MSQNTTSGPFDNNPVINLLVTGAARPVTDKIVTQLTTYLRIPGLENGPLLVARKGPSLSEFDQLSPWRNITTQESKADTDNYVINGPLVTCRLHFIPETADSATILNGIYAADSVIILTDLAQKLPDNIMKLVSFASLVNCPPLLLLIRSNNQDSVDKLQYNALRNQFDNHCRDLGYSEYSSYAVSQVLASGHDSEELNTPGQQSAPPLIQWPAPHSLLSAPCRLIVDRIDHEQSAVNRVSGTVISGTVSVADNLCLSRSGEITKLMAIRAAGESVNQLLPGASGELDLDADLHPQCGDLLADARNPCQVSDQFSVTLAWLDQEPALPGRQYRLKNSAHSCLASIMAIKSSYSPNSQILQAVRFLNQDSVSIVTLGLDSLLPFEPFNDNRVLGSFLLQDIDSGRVLGAGTIHYSLRRAQNLYRQAPMIDQRARTDLNRHGAKLLWFTGLSGSGKSTLANAVEQKLHQQGIRTYILDGDNVRRGLNKDLGFTDADRVENIRRVAEVAKLMVDAGLVVLAAFISPFRSERQLARSLFNAGEFLEIFVDVPLEIAESRDPKGLYKKARRGELPNFTGIDSAYEAPTRPDVVVDTGAQSIDACVELIVNQLDLQTPH